MDFAMDHDSLFRYFDRHKYTYDPNDRPDYELQRMAVSRTKASLADVIVSESSICGVTGLWVRGGEGEGRSRCGIVLFIHGGAFVRGDRYTDASFCGALALGSRYDVYSTDYALAPEHPFPQGLDDVFDVYASLCRENEASNVVLCGESAGATMALAAANRAKVEGFPLPNGIVLISPCVQFERALPSYSSNLGTDCMVTNFMDEALAEYFQTDDPKVVRSPLASPLNGDFDGFPPVYITASDCEVLRDDAVLLEKRMTGQGVECTLDMAHGLMHVYPVMTALEESKEAVGRICRFLDGLCLC